MDETNETVRSSYDHQEEPMEEGPLSTSYSEYTMPSNPGSLENITQDDKLVLDDEISEFRTINVFPGVELKPKEQPVIERRISEMNRAKSAEPQFSAKRNPNQTSSNTSGQSQTPVVLLQRMGSVIRGKEMDKLNRAEISKEIEDLKGTIFRLKAELGCVEQQKQVACQNLQQTAKKHQAILQDLRRKNAELKWNLDEKDKLVSGIEELRNTTAKDQEREEQTMREKEELQELSKNLSEELATCMEDLRKVQEELAQKTEALQTALQDKEQAEQMLESQIKLATYLDEEVKQITKQSETIADEKELLIQELQHKQVVNADLIADARNMEQRAKAAQEKCQMMSEELLCQKARLVELSDVLNAERNKMSDQNSSISVLMQQKISLQNELQNEMVKATQLEYEKETVCNEIATLHEKVFSMEDMIMVLQERQEQDCDVMEGQKLTEQQERYSKYLMLKFKRINEFLLLNIESNSDLLAKVANLVEQRTHSMAAISPSSKSSMDYEAFMSDWMKVRSALAKIVKNDRRRKKEGPLPREYLDRNLSDILNGTTGVVDSGVDNPELSLRWQWDVCLAQVKRLVLKWHRKQQPDSEPNSAEESATSIHISTVSMHQSLAQTDDIIPYAEYDNAE